MQELKNYKRIVLVLGALILVIFIFRGWLYPGVITFGDWGYLYREHMSDFLKLSLWSGARDGGMYHSNNYLPIEFSESLVAQILNVDFSVVERIFWYVPFLFLAVFSIFYLWRTLFKEKYALGAFFAVFIYAANTYVFCITQGGQIAVAVAYALTPLILALFIRLTQKHTFRLLILISLSLGIQGSYDPRILYLTFLLLIFYSVFRFLYNPEKWLAKRFIFSLLFILFLVALLQFYWLGPAFLVQSPLSAGYRGVGWVTSLSFMKISHCVTLCHPFWPENILGRVYSPAFIFFLYPFLAFLPLFFYPRDRRILFLSSVAVLGIFLTKGSNIPFGFVYVLLFKYFPGFFMFRDPSKFYLFIALPYALLIGVSIGYLIRRGITFFTRRKRLVSSLLFLGFTILLLIPIYPAVSNQLGGTFLPVKVPKAHLKIKDFLQSQNPFFRTFWVPHYSRFSFYSSRYPMYNRLDEKLKLDKYFCGGEKPPTPYLSKILGLGSVKYLILPPDIEPYIFWTITEQKYYHNLLKNQKGLIEIAQFGKEAFFKNPSIDRYLVQKSNVGRGIIFENQFFCPHIFTTYNAVLVNGGIEALIPLTKTKYLDNKPCLLFVDQLAFCDQSDLASKVNTVITYKEERLRIKPITQFKEQIPPKISYQKINPAKYRVQVKAEEPFWLVFSESYHPGWKAYVRQLPVTSYQLPVEWSALMCAWKDRGKRIELEEHLTVNGYANGWWVDPSKVQSPKSKVQEMEIVLEFVPQRLFEVGVLISGLTLLGCVGYLVITGVRRRNKRRV